ncbi:MAG: VOC family protein [Caldilineaceae bacterium]
MNVQSNYLGVVVQDLAAASAFYRDTLGFAVDEGESIPGFYTQFKLNGESILALQAEAEVPDGQIFAPALQVEAIDQLYATWQARGVDVLEEPHDKPFGRTFLFRTPAGHVFRAYQPHVR